MELHEDVLDDVDAIETHDSGRMLLAISTGAAQMRLGAVAADEAGIDRVEEDGRPRAVVVCGVGTAALVGDMLEALAGTALPTPVVTVRGPELPGWVGAADLVCCLSHSGSTAATVAAFDEANRRGCRLLTVGPAATPLAERAEQAKAVHVPLRRGATQRASLWSLAVPVLVAAHRLRLVELPPRDIEAAAEALARCSEQCRPGSESFVNPAKSTALAIAGSLPVLWGSSAIASVAAARFAGQLADNAKYPAVPMPAHDAGHGALPAFDGVFGARASSGGLDDFFRDRVDDPQQSTRLRLVVLRDTVEQPLVASRVDATLDIVEHRGLPVTLLTAEGDRPLVRLAGLVALGDYISVYLGLLLGIDPTPVPFASDLADRVLVT